MKKATLTLALFLTLGFIANAQSDGFFSTWSEGSGREFGSSNDLNAPTKPIGSTENENLPLGEGLLIMTALGAGYALKKRNNK